MPNVTMKPVRECFKHVASWDGMSYSLNNSSAIVACMSTHYCVNPVTVFKFLLHVVIVTEAHIKLYVSLCIRGSWSHL